jgi:hypothetical protein
MVAGTAPTGTPPQAARRRLALLVRVAASAGEFSPKLSDAVDHATDAEVRIMSDLVDRGMSIPDLVSVLQGAHVIVGDDGLYERWIFPTSRRRMSSHHRTVDKSRTPDYGLDGPLVRESLHGKASIGTWVQLERTKATFQWGRLPSWSDVVHIRDYVLYRLTGKNVGPWGLSAHVDTRPMLLRPPQATPGRAAMRALAAFSRRRADLSMDADEQARWGDLLTPEVAPVGPAGDLFGPPTPQDPADLLPSRPHEPDLGLGLFGSLALVRATAPLRSAALALLSAPAVPVGLAAPEGPVEAVEVPMREAAPIVVGAQRLPGSGTRPVFIGIEEDRA